MGKLFRSRDAQPIRVPPTPKDGKPTIGEQKAAAASGKNRKIIVISVCSAAVVLLISVIVSIWYFFAWPANDGLILNNVMVGGINLGGLTKEGARNVLHEATDHTFSELDMVIELPDTTMNLSPADTGALLDVDGIVKEAFAYGRIGSYKEREAIKEASLTSTHQIPLLSYLTLNQEYIKGELEAYGAGFNSVYTPSTLLFDRDAPVLNAGNKEFREDAPCQTMRLYMGTPGRNIDIEGLYNEVLEAYGMNTFKVTAELTDAETIPEPFDVKALYDVYRVDPADAYFDKETASVIHEVYGYSFDLEDALSKVEQANYGDTVEIPFHYLLPEIHYDGLSALIFRDVLGAYETQHSGEVRRTTNLQLACAAINGLILMPGDTFDFNTVVGERTSEKGYRMADAYSSGETVKTLGGGICQVSSTLYYCTLVGDLEIVARSPHSYVSSYMPKGMDATVSWGGPHFTFKNNTNYPIRIEAKEENGYVKVQLIGTDEKDYYIKMTYEVIGSQSPETVYKDYYPDNAQGYSDGQVISTAYKGYTVKTYKEKYDKETDELISRDFDRTSQYKKRDEVIVRIVDYPEE